MSINVEWTNEEKTILYWLFKSEWTWEEYHTAKLYSQNAMRHAGHPVDVILDFGMSKYMPAHAVTNFSATLREKPPSNLNHVVAVGANGLLRRTCGVLRQLYPARMSNVTEAITLDHAMRMLDGQAERLSS